MVRRNDLAGARPARASLAGRAVLALAFLVGFYVLALAIAGGLFWIPYAEWTYAGRIHPKLALACAFGGGVILWSALPRFDRFVAPGARLTKAEQPRLFAEIERIAAATDQEIPAEVYLVGDVNAWVAQRGGILGLGSRRVMGLGLPLLRALTGSQLRAVLAHEFGHFHGGDTRLGPLVYRTREAIERTLANMTDGDGRGTWLQAPFRWYGKLFLRVTHAISRRQELDADALAARVAGAPALISGLRATRGAAGAFQAYWQGEYLPVLSAGFLPPLAEGFGVFLRADPISAAVDELVAKDMRSTRADPYDTHPPLPERIAALESLSDGDGDAEDGTEDRTDEADAPALTLLADVPALEAGWLRAVGAPDQVARLAPLPWEEVGRAVCAPGWRSLLASHAGVLAGLRVLDLAAKLKDLPAFAKPFAPPHAEELALHTCAAGIGVALLERGAEIEALPGTPARLHGRGETVEPVALVRRIAAGEVTADEWHAFCVRQELEGVSLGELAGRAATSATPTRIDALPGFV